MANQVKEYDSATSLTTSPTTIFDMESSQYNTLQVNNADAIDIILNFGGGTSTGQDLTVQAGVSFIKGFACTGIVTARTKSGSTSANIFVQVTRA